MSEVSTGKSRAQHLLIEKMTWQATFYADLPTVTHSRQFRRWIQRFTKAKAEAQLKAKALGSRRQKVAAL